MYLSSPLHFDIGQNVILWDIKNQDGKYLENGQYSYYIWAYDSNTEKHKLTDQFFTRPSSERSMGIQGFDEDGLSLSAPFFYTKNSRWTIGYNTLDQSLLETTNILYDEGWNSFGSTVIDPTDYNYFYLAVRNNVSRKSSIQKLKWEPNGDAEIQRDWGENNGYATLYNRVGGFPAGVTSDSKGNYLYTADDNHTASDESDSGFYIFDFDGNMITEIDLTSWWSSKKDFENSKKNMST